MPSLVVGLASPQFAIASAFAVAGFLIGGPIGAQIGFTVGTVVGMALFPTSIEGPRTNDFRVTNSSYKIPIPRVYIAGVVGGNIIQVGPVVQVKNERKVGLGSNINEYRNFRTFAVQLCEGEIVTVLRIWANDELIYDERAYEVSNLGVRGALREGIKRKFDFEHTVYTGSEDQQPDPSLEEVVGAGNQPAYRGTAYVVFRDFPLSEFNDQMPRFQFEVALADDVWSLKDTDPVVDGTFPNERFRTLLAVWRDDEHPHEMFGVLFQDADDTYVTDPNRRHRLIRWNAWTGQVISSRNLTYRTAADELLYGIPVPEWCSPLCRALYPSISHQPFLFAVYSKSSSLGTTLSDTWFVAIDPETLRVVRKSLTPAEAGFAPASGAIPYRCLYLCCSPRGDEVWAKFTTTGPSSDRGLYGLYFPGGGDMAEYYTGAQLGCPTDNTYEAFVFDDEPFVGDGDRLWAAYKLGTFPNQQLYLDKFAGLGAGADPFKVGSFLVGDLPSEFAAAGAPPDIVGLTFVPLTREILCWLENGTTVSQMIRFSIVTEAASSSWMGYTNACEFGFEGSNSAANADKASGRWTDRALFVGGELKKHLSVDDGIYLFNAETGEETYYPFSLWGSNFPSGVDFDWISNLIYEPYSEVVWSAWLSTDYSATSPFLPVEEGFQRFFLRRADGQVGELSDILNDLLSDSDELTSVDYDFINQSQLVRGFTVDNRMTIRAAIQALQPAFFFDIVESDWQLKGVNRGGSVFVTIEDDHLGAGSDPNVHTERLTITRVNEQELPAWVDYGFFDIAKDYLSNTVPGRRPGATMSSQNVMLVDVPVVMNAQEASDNVRRFISSIWSGRELSKLTTWLYYMTLEPGDSFRVIRNGRVRRFRVNRMTIGANFALEIEGVSENDELPSAGYALTGTPPDVSGFPPSEIAVIYPPKLSAMDTALLRDGDNVPGIYVGAGPALPSDEWNGAIVSKSASPTTGFVQVASVPSATVMGYADNELPAPADWTQWDRDNTLYVRLDGEQTLTSSTEDDVLDDYSENLLAISNSDGGWELCQFVSAVNMGDRLWYLSTLLRGRLGTEQHRTGHTFGDRVVFLGQTSVAPANYAASEIGATRYYRAVSTGLAPTGAATEVLQTTRRLLPYAPFDVQASRDVSGNITITWIRRSRSPGPFLWDSPVFEDKELYQVDVLDGYSTVRTIEASSESASYTAAMQTADFGGLVADGSLQGVVYQISATVGRGYPAEFEGL